MGILFWNLLTNHFNILNTFNYSDISTFFQKSTAVGKEGNYPDDEHYRNRSSTILGLESVFVNIPILWLNILGFKILVKQKPS